jgi:hypothetical protein
MMSYARENCAATSPLASSIRELKEPPMQPSALVYRPRNRLKSLNRSEPSHKFDRPLGRKAEGARLQNDAT